MTLAFAFTRRHPHASIVAKKLLLSRHHRSRRCTSLWAFSGHGKDHDDGEGHRDVANVGTRSENEPTTVIEDEEEDEASPVEQPEPTRNSRRAYHYTIT